MIDKKARGRRLIEIDLGPNGTDRVQIDDTKYTLNTAFCFFYIATVNTDSRRGLFGVFPKVSPKNIMIKKFKKQQTNIAPIAMLGNRIVKTMASVYNWEFYPNVSSSRDARWRTKNFILIFMAIVIKPLCSEQSKYEHLVRCYLKINFTPNWPNRNLS